MAAGQRERAPAHSTMEASDRLGGRGLRLIAPPTMTGTKRETLKVGRYSVSLLWKDVEKRKE